MPQAWLEIAPPIQEDIAQVCKKACSLLFKIFLGGKLYVCSSVPSRLSLTYQELAAQPLEASHTSHLWEVCLCQCLLTALDFLKFVGLALFSFWLQVSQDGRLILLSGISALTVCACIHIRKLVSKLYCQNENRSGDQHQHKSYTKPINIPTM